MIRRTNETDKEIPLNEPNNLLEGMQTILAFAEDSALGEPYFENVKTPMEYLCRRLSLTPTQVTLLAIIMELGFQRRVSLSDISRFLNTSNLDMLSKSTDLTALQTKRLITEMKGRRDACYIIPQEVYEAFRHNEVYAHKVPSLRNDEELIEQIDRMLANLDDRDSETNTELFDQDMREMLFANSQIHLARILLGVMKKTNDDEFRVMLLMSMLWIRDEDVDIEGHRFSIVIKQQLKVRQMINSLLKGQSVLIKKKIVKVSDSEGILSRDVFSLTPDFFKSLTPDRVSNSKEEKELWSKRLTHHDDIQQKVMFYNPETVNEVERIKHLLEPEQMSGVLARLKERGLRGGFTCLLYGGPGTGKTETVLQLARSCGRDIFQVEVSKLRSKWYGESEKLVKGVFDEYRQMVAKSKVAPIMFFNEADAIFNRRMENAERTSDKSENALQNIILQEMETLDGILIATTNLQGNLDSAFERRFLYKLFLDKPTPEVKTHIWQSMLPDLSESEARLLASQFDFSGGQIENVVRKRFIDEVLTGEKIDINALTTLCRNEQWSDSKRKQTIGFTHYGSQA